MIRRGTWSACTGKSRAVQNLLHSGFRGIHAQPSQGEALTLEEYAQMPFRLRKSLVPEANLKEILKKVKKALDKLFSAFFRQFSAKPLQGACNGLAMEFQHFPINHDYLGRHCSTACCDFHQKRKLNLIRSKHVEIDDFKKRKSNHPAFGWANWR
jgi:hypothetical protein